MGMVSEFKEFIARGNVIDLAVAVVIGAAFGKIVTALVDGIIMPVIGGLTGGASVSDWKYVLSPATVDAAGAEVAEVAIQYGAFIQTVIDFLLIAFVIFLFIKAYNRLKKAEVPAEEAPAEPAEEVLLLREIRDSLKK
ncbi:large-conductance mechanosensitive channel protein MscL [Marilutibacter alkalisoli]|uniref:Large-conductance mechanosensitive channel n=1 Tax=Marilutibacter alkalisoli TaxID=2591633 RepID=A0A514BPB4_9GAMM|nr:large-conductance mechanosensitive channel protein MscL [Lysobacter alkalisoli]QDH69230.1 large-conductance mechanosensitive channel protein MscL [Lysobacter alkalisoli]